MPDKRKVILYGLLATILLVMGGESAYNTYVGEPRQQRERKISTLEKNIQKEKRNLNLAIRDAKKMIVWEKQSLPANPELARSTYRSWLMERVTAAKFLSPNVDSGSAINRKGMYQSLSFSVRGQGTLGQLTQFLYEFYSADFLHQIRSLSMIPVRSQGVLDLSISIEALILPTTENQDGLNDRKSDRLAFSQLSDYRVIVGRNLFGVGGGLDEINQTYLSGVTAADGTLEAWFTLRATDKILKLKAGQDLQVGQFRGTIVAIDESDVVLESEGERWLLSIGENLDQAFALPPEF